MTKKLKKRSNRSITDEADAIRRHHDFLTHYREGKTGATPRPGFKDCPECPLRAAAGDDEAARRATCRECPYADYPTSPSRRFLLALEMTRFPDYVLAASLNDLTPREHQSIADLERWRDTQKEGFRLAATVGMGVFSGR